MKWWKDNAIISHHFHLSRPGEKETPNVLLHFNFNLRSQQQLFIVENFIDYRIDVIKQGFKTQVELSFISKLESCGQIIHLLQ